MREYMKPAGPALPELKPFNGRELKCIEALLVMDARMAQAGDALRQRLRAIPNGWRDWRLMDTILYRLLQQIVDTLPNKSRQYLTKLKNHDEMLIRFEPAARTPEWLLIRDVDLKEIVNAAMASECATCLKEGKQIDRCPLRRAMIDICPPHQEPATGCGYREAAMVSEYGHYI